MKFLIINGPNLNLLGKREPAVYGNETFEDYLSRLRIQNTGHEINYFQSNIEGEIISKLHEFGFEIDGIILNAAGYTHTSVSISDAIAAIKTPVVEVHISNVYARDQYRHTTLIGKNCKGIITGFGLDSYRLALMSFL